MTIYDLMDMLELADVKLPRLKVIIYILEHSNFNTFEFKGSYDDIAKATNVSYSTVAETVQSGIEEGILFKKGPRLLGVDKNILTDSGECALEFRNYAT